MSMTVWIVVGVGVVAVALGAVFVFGKKKERVQTTEEESATPRERTVEKEPIVPESQKEVERPEPTDLSALKVEEEKKPEPALPVLSEPIEAVEGIERESFARYSSKRVLVVEDNKINQKLIVTLFDKSGVTLETAEDGIEALEKLRAPGADYDLVLMDVNMPRMDGLEATREIRKDAQLKDIPVVALTASTNRDEVQAILESGMNAYLDKPIVLGKLYHIFEVFTENYQPPVKEKKKVVSEVVPERKVESQEGEEKAIDRSVLDPEAGLAFSNNDRELYATLLEDFLATYADSARRLAELLEKRDYEGIHALIVDLEGISGTVGANGVYQLMLKMRQVLGRRAYSLLEDYLEEYREALKRLKRESEKYLAAA